MSTPVIALEYNKGMGVINNTDIVLEWWSPGLQLEVHSWCWAMFYMLLDTYLNNKYMCWEKHTNNQKVVCQITSHVACINVLRHSRRVV